MKTNAVNRERRKLALTICDYVAAVVSKTGDWNPDDELDIIASMIPTSQIEMAAEISELESKCSGTTASRVSILDPLREALGITSKSIQEVITLATKEIIALRKYKNRIKKNLRDSSWLSSEN